MHLRLSLSTDVSGHDCGCAVHSSAGDCSFGDNWTEEQLALNISSKEMLALLNALKAAPPEIGDCRVDVSVDSQAVIDTVAGQGSRSSPQLTVAANDLYFTLVERNLQLKLFHVSSEHNRADGPSRHLSPLDSTLSSKNGDWLKMSLVRLLVTRLISWPWIRMHVLGWNGETLPHSTPFPSPGSSGVNLFSQDILDSKFSMSNPYAFPPFNLIGPVVRFLCGFWVPFTTVVPEVQPVPFWWPWLMAFVSARLLLGSPGDFGVFSFPSKSGFRLVSFLFSLWACGVSRF